MALQGEGGAEAFPLLSLATHIVAAYVSAHSVDTSEIGEVMRQVYATLRMVANVAPDVLTTLDPAVSVAESVQPDYIVCLEDGKKLKMLKRHLRTAYNLTPQQYRDRWGLSNTYPMVAPNYAVRRSRIAKTIGLGTNTKRH
ncbi:MAG: MucR family transcriptional regulator [Holosporales bacterium]|nr:MucR family transcriptional regulator [Holosporales bacterium]